MCGSHKTRCLVTSMFVVVLCMILRVVEAHMTASEPSCVISRRSLGESFSPGTIMIPLVLVLDVDAMAMRAPQLRAETHQCTNWNLHCSAVHFLFPRARRDKRRGGQERHRQSGVRGVGDEHERDDVNDRRGSNGNCSRGEERHTEGN